MSNDHQVFIVDSKDRFFEYGADSKMSVSIHSNLPVPLVVKQRNGVSSVTRPKHGEGYQTGNITIQIELLVKKEVFLYIDNQYMESLPEEYKILHDAVRTMQDRGMQIGQMYYARICLTFDRSYFDRHGGQFYLPIADVLLSILPLEATDEHPYSVSAMQKRQSFRMQEDYENLALYAVRLVDRFEQVGPRYMNIAGDVFRIQPFPTDQLTDQMADGLHILGTQPMRSPKDTANTARSTFIPMDKLLADPNKYGVWSTFGEARHQGNKQLETAQNALEEALRKADKKDRIIDGLKKDVEEAKAKQKQEGSLVVNKGLTELIKLATAMIGIVKLLK